MVRRLIISHATAATVARWATQGSKRVRAKYEHAITACRVLNRRESPLVGLDAEGVFGELAELKFSWGAGFIRQIGWYGEWHVKHGRLSMSLHSCADLRAWARRGFPAKPDFFRKQAGTLDHGTTSLRVHEGKTKRCKAIRDESAAFAARCEVLEELEHARNSLPGVLTRRRVQVAGQVAKMVGQYVAWLDVPQGTLVREGRREQTGYAVRDGEQGRWVFDAQCGSNWGFEETRGDGWAWVAGHGAGRRVQIIAVNLTGVETADELRAMADSFSAREKQGP